MIDRENLCDIEAEQALCGIALTDDAAADEALAVLRPEAFYRDSHRRIWQAIGALRARRAHCDVLTVAAAVQAAGHEQDVPATYVRDLSRAAPAPSTALEHAAQVREANARREVVRAAKEAIKRASDPACDMATVLSGISEGFRGATEAAAAGSGPELLSDLIVSAMEEIEAVYEGTVAPGIRTGIPMLDAMLSGGLQRGEMTVIGARPSVGKSSVAQQIATHISHTESWVYFASAEMSKRMVARRGLAAASRIDARKFRGRKDGIGPHLQDADWPILSRGIGWLGDHANRLWIDDESRTVEEIATQARRLHAREPLSLIVVDHLQHLRTPGGGRENRTQAIGRMAQECKDLSMSLDVPIIVLSQLRRLAPGETRKPQLSDLRESGDIEQVADVVLLLHRPSGEVPPPLCEIECAIAKNRNDELNTLSLWHERATGRWFDASNRHEAVNPASRTARSVTGEESA